MEDDDRSLAHHVPQLVQVVQEVALQCPCIADVDGAFDVTSLVLIVKAAVNDDSRMLLPLVEQVGERLCTDRVARRIECIEVVHQRQ